MYKRESKQVPPACSICCGCSGSLKKVIQTQENINVLIQPSLLLFIFILILKSYTGDCTMYVLLDKRLIIMIIM